MGASADASPKRLNPCRQAAVERLRAELVIWWQAGVSCTAVAYCSARPWHERERERERETGAHQACVGAYAESSQSGELVRFQHLQHIGRRMWMCASMARSMRPGGAQPCLQLQVHTEVQVCPGQGLLCAGDVIQHLCSALRCQLGHVGCKLLVSPALHHRSELVSLCEHHLTSCGQDMPEAV